jgi:hypothetical protein
MSTGLANFIFRCTGSFADEFRAWFGDSEAGERL